MDMTYDTDLSIKCHMGTASNKRTPKLEGNVGKNKASALHQENHNCNACLQLTILEDFLMSQCVKKNTTLRSSFVLLLLIRDFSKCQYICHFCLNIIFCEINLCLILLKDHFLGGVQDLLNDLQVSLWC